MANYDTLVNNRMYPTTHAKVAFIAQVVLSTVMFGKTLNASRKGNYSKATAYAVLWHGYSASLANDIKFRYQLVQDGHNFKSTPKDNPAANFPVR